MVSDQGTNLLGATEILGIDAVNDCRHVLMNALKKELSDDTQVRRIISSPTRTLKTSGINQQSRESWCRQLAAYRRETKLYPLAEKIVSTLINNYFDRHEYLLEKHGRLICCSDIIESVFGRYKN